MPAEELIDRSDIVDQMTDARARTLLLVASVTEADLRTQHDPLMGPIMWDLGHIAIFEELWLLQNLEGKVEFGEMPGMYNPFENPRSVRGQLQLPSRAEMLEFLAGIRRRVLDRLALEEFSARDPLVRDAYVYRMVLQHEMQHNETMLQTLQLKQGEPYQAPRAFAAPVNASPGGGMVLFPGGDVDMGTADRTAAYDNERGVHTVNLQPFYMDVHPVTNEQYLQFMNEGGYAHREFWSSDGWDWVKSSDAAAPKYWARDGSTWFTRSMDRVGEVDPMRPVCHVCWHEAEAFARYAGKRLPTETEWEAACTWNPDTNEKQLFPWGPARATPALANIDQLSFGVAPIGAYQDNYSPIGCYGMIGDVWEWTSSDFTPYPGYQTFPYPEYSEVFFGSEYKVLRGASWATRPLVARSTFRNWDYPIRRQIFAGFRCARDA